VLPRGLLGAIEAYEAADASERASVDRIRELLRTRADPFTRGHPEHVTASAVVAHPASGRFLLVRHRRLERWLQPGGHIEAQDASTLDAARREALEETGVEGLEAPFGDRILDVDVHTIPPKSALPGHVHYDVRHLLTAVERAESSPAPEVLAGAWLSIDEAVARGADESLLRALRKAVRLLESQRVNRPARPRTPPGEAE